MLGFLFYIIYASHSLPHKVLILELFSGNVCQGNKVEERVCYMHEDALCTDAYKSKKSSADCLPNSRKYIIAQ